MSHFVVNRDPSTGFFRTEHPEYPYVSAQMVASSVWKGARIDSIQYTAPRFILAEINTHGLLARSARSSRAVPSQVLIDEVLTDPVIPYAWKARQKGMGSDTVLAPDVRRTLEIMWRGAAIAAAASATAMVSLDLVKETANRIIEPWVKVHGIMTATSWSNFLRLRLAPNAQPEFQALAACVAVLRTAVTPTETPLHVPYVTGPEQNMYSEDTLLKISGARCARVSYAAFDGSTVSADVEAERADKLIANNHMSPFDHPACHSEHTWGRFRQWSSYRSTLPDHACATRRYVVPPFVVED